jgi:hypothetical protein
LLPRSHLPHPLLPAEMQQHQQHQHQQQEQWLTGLVVVWCWGSHSPEVQLELQGPSRCAGSQTAKSTSLSTRSCAPGRLQQQQQQQRQ